MTRSKTHAKLSVMLSLLKAFKLAEWLAVINNLLAVFAIAYSPIFLVKILATMLLALGFTVFYFALRIRIDIVLFEQWDGLDMAALDDALTRINPKHQAGRTLEARLQGSFKLLYRGLLLLFVQFCLLILAVWFI